ncbi:sugar ABC transporter substrate-binding protein [Leucobacter allii]|uniref:Sugar ABC transporter substrate-binding protein n=1 Tax=Leucobacter allii TaxID=2932247 RepID=A0ABY4FIM6_9MICO|nr:sugar ABC transporter substrate-binding protein [Leucobacter allii]UOQ55936.1 sugar ABC transporter substrate-binding protein [Leucobacter allii]UOR00452.1 sugar ABC transporter substrate-binding protein [Leucobacter allii]
MHTSHRLRAIPVAALAAALLLSGCSASNAGAAQDSATINLDAPPPEVPELVAEFEDVEAGSGAGLTIGFTQLALSSPFPQALQAGMEAQAELAGIDLITCDSELDAAKALDCARQFKTQNVDGLVTFQADAASAPAICDAGPQVPVFSVDIAQEPCESAFVGAANEYAGQLIGYHLGQWFGEHERCDYDAFISLESTAVGEVNEQRMGGIRESFASVCGEIHDLKVIDTGAGGQADVALQQMTDTLTALPGADKVIVVGINEDVIVSALAAARTQNREDDLYLGVQNFDPTNCTITDAEHWLGSAAYFPEKYANLIVPNMIRAIAGEDVPEQILVPHEFINAENVREYYPDFAC